jgi:hypothetical protein
LSYIFRNGIDFVLAPQTPSQTVVSNVDRSRLNLYSVQSSPYQLGIGYRRGSSVSGLCYSYTLQVDIAPTTTVQNQVTCPSGITGASLPSTITVDPTTNYVAGSIDSFFQGWGSVTGMSQSISFTTKGPGTTSVIISLSYNSLVTAFSMKLYNAKNSLVSTAQTRGQANKSGKTNVYLYLASSIRCTFPSPLLSIMIRIDHSRCASRKLHAQYYTPNYRYSIHPCSPSVRSVRVYI